MTFLLLSKTSIKWNQMHFIQCSFEAVTTFLSEWEGIVLRSLLGWILHVVVGDCCSVE